MRVAIVGSPWVPIPPPAYGGTEAALDALARGLVAAGHDVLLCTTGDSTCPVPRTSYFPEAVGVGGRMVLELQHVVHAYDTIVDWRADVVHDHTLVGPFYAQRFPGLPVVTTNHGRFEGELRELYAAMGDRVPIVAISYHQASTALHIPVAGVIHHGLDIERIPAGVGSGGYAMFLGRMCTDKGVRTAALVARAAGIPLKIAAKMTAVQEVAYFQSEVAPLLGNDIEFVGEARRSEKIQLLSRAACLLNPIQWPEPFGMVMIEALASGTPVVATPCGSVPELVDDGRTGFLRSGIEPLASAVQSVSTLERAVCRETAVRMFSLHRMAAEHTMLYERVIDRCPSAAVSAAGPRDRVVRTSRRNATFGACTAAPW